MLLFACPVPRILLIAESFLRESFKILATAKPDIHTLSTMTMTAWGLSSFQLWLLPSTADEGRGSSVDIGQDNREFYL